MRKKYIMMMFFILALMLVLPGMTAAAKIKPGLAAKKKGTALITATYKKYKCRITIRVKEKKQKQVAEDSPALSSSDVALYYLSEEYKDYIPYDSSHLRKYRFRVFGTKKEVRDWKLSGEGTD